MRTVLAAPATFNFSTAGVDDPARNGSPGQEWLTLQYGYYRLQSGFDLAGQAVDFQCEGGAHCYGLAATGPLLGQAGPGALTIHGYKGYPLSVYVKPKAGNCFSATNGASFMLADLALDTSIANQDMIGVGYGGQIVLDEGMFFGVAGSTPQNPTNHVSVAWGGSVIVCKGYTITSGAQCHMDVASGASVYFDTNGQPNLIDVTVQNCPNFEAAFMFVNGGQVNCQAVGWHGSATGVRDIVRGNGVLDVMGAGPTYFPGSSVVAPQSGGVRI